MKTTYPRLYPSPTEYDGSPMTHRTVYAWLLKLAQRGMLWHMDDLPSECGNLKTPALYVPMFTASQANLADRDRTRALEICRNAGVDIHRLCLIALWAARRGRK